MHQARKNDGQQYVVISYLLLLMFFPRLLFRDSKTNLKYFCESYFFNIDVLILVIFHFNC